MSTLNANVDQFIRKVISKSQNRTNRREVGRSFKQSNTLIQNVFISLISIQSQMLIQRVFILLLIASLACSARIPLKIFSVSSDPAVVKAPVYSSQRGGRVIYIKAVGHNPMPSQNRIFIGGKPCFIPADGVTDTFISCETSDRNNNTNSEFFPIQLSAYGETFKTSYPHGVYFTSLSTPQLAAVFPTAAYGGQNVNFYGIHRISNIGDGLRVLGDITKLSLGNDLCSRFDVDQKAITSTWYDYLLCIKSNQQEAGKYNITEHVLPGKANNARYMRRASFDPNQYFEFTAMPTITSISPSTGNVAGQTLTITGNGFSATAKNNTVSVDGNDCKVTYASNGQVVCTIAPKDAAKSAKIDTNSGSQQSGYFSGAGVKYARYRAVSGSSIDTINTFVTAVRNSNATVLGAAQQSGYRAQMRESNVYGENYAQTWSGYFTAPVNGTYTFRGNADDNFAVYLTQNYGSAEPASTPLIFSNTHQIQGNFYIHDVPSAQANITLVAGKSYYLEAYHLNYAGGGFFDLQINVPNTDNTLSFQVHQVDTIALNSTVQPENQTYSFNGVSGTISLWEQRKNDQGTLSLFNVTNFQIGSSASSFQSALNKLDMYKSFMTTVTRNIYDANNNTLSNTTGAARIDYLVSIYKHRGTEETKKATISNVDYNGTHQITQGETHSPIISGTFTLSIAGVPILHNNIPNIPHNISAQNLQTAIRNSTIVGFEHVEVALYQPVSCDYACTWVIQYKGFNASVPSIAVNPAFLTGGVSGSLTLVSSARRYYSPNIIFAPVDYRFLNTHTGSANVLVRTNDIPAICNGTCSYTFDTFSEITSLSLAGAKISLALSDPKTRAFPISDISIQVRGEPCTIDPASTFSSLDCYVKNNTDGSPLLVAGTFTPLVTIKNIGIIARASNVNQLIFSLSNLALTVSSGGNNGGILTSLTGRGFPLDKNLITISVCSKLATIKSINNNNVQFYLPSCNNTGNQIVNITIGSIIDTTLNFNYTNSSGAPIINSLNPTSANPGVKGTLEINGENFGTDASQVTVFLSNATGKIYPLTILTINDTYIKVGVPGGQAGNFLVEVNRLTVGDSVSNAGNLFSYVFSVSSVSPSTGSINGGTLITITGTNFSPDAQNTLVYIGDTLNWFCNIENITATQIKCRTPPISKAYAVGTPVKVYVSTRLIILNSCVGSCSTFTYMAADSSPILTAISSTTTNVGSITLTGTTLLDSNSFAQVALTNRVTGEVVVLPAATKTSTSITFNITNSIISGAYSVKARNLVGESNGLDLLVNWNIGSLVSNLGSTAGALLTLTGGAGYPSSIDGLIFTVTASSGNNTYPVSIVSCCSSNSITFEVPSAPSGSTLTLTFKGPVNTPTLGYSVSTTYTPTANITQVVSNGNVTVGAQNITFASTSSLAATITSVKLVSVQDKSFAITVPSGSWTTTGNAQNATAITKFTAVINAGSYRLLVNTQPYGYILMNSTVDVAIPTNLVSNPQSVSFNGGRYTIEASYLSPVSYITVNGFRGDVISYTNTNVTYQVPALVTTETQAAFNLAEVSKLTISQFTFFSDNTENTSSVGNAFDELINTVYTSPNIQCWIGLDAGAGIKASISRVSFFSNLNWANVAQFILYSSFQGSNDQTTWHNLATVDQTVHSGWNTFASKDTTAYRYIRFLHNSTSKCSLAEVQLYGILYSSITPNLTSQLADVVYHDGLTNYTFTNQVNYTQATTPIVETISPRYGHTGGGYTITLTGTNLGQGTPVVTIDGINCTGATSTATSITCTVGPRSSAYKLANTFTVTVGSSSAILRDTFLYVLKWSNATTWGVDSFPVDGDLVYVPVGTSLLVDVDTPILKGIAVQGGNLIFSNDTDLTVQAGFITMNKGNFIAGTQKNPHIRKLTFIMHGGYYGIHQPMFGNKGIGCLNCKFSMYGKPRAFTWSTITATILPNTATFTVKDNVDWVVGEEIVVASTSFEHTEAQRRTIKSINGNTIEVDAPFLYKHVSVIEPYGDKFLVMQAEVGLLTRNIKMMGDSDSLAKKYGSHLMLSGKTDEGFEAHVAYSEFTHCGQPQIVGRYCIHFHMAGDVPTSFARGNAVHDSFARVITIHGVHYLTVENNVGYRVSGHNFFVQDGIQTHNTIRNNLAIGSLAVTNMLQTDTSTASFWITNPTNNFYGNRAAGGDFYGIWYEIKPNPDGPSATMDVCPMGNPLGYVANNIAHSNTRFGLRVFHLYSRTFPCKPVRNDSNAADSWADNPSIQSVFSNFTVYKNLEDGVLAEQTGNVVFDNFVIAESYHSGAEFYLANFTREPPMVNNSVIIGMSASNAHSDLTNYTNKMSAVITGRSGVTKLSNIGFYNYPNGSILFQTCRLCDDPVKYTNIGTEVIVDKLSFTQINGRMLNMINIKKDVIYDLDGSLSSKFDGNTRTSGTIVWKFPHIATYNGAACPSATDPAAWDNAIMCDQTVTIKRVLFGNIINKQLFVSQEQKAAQLPTIASPFDPNSTAAFYSNITSQGFKAMQPHVESAYTWSMPYITGRIYQIWWGTGIDFTHLSIYTAPNFTPNDKGIIFKFNYSQNRELYNIGPMRGGVKRLTSLDYIIQTNTTLDVNTCRNGEYNHDNDVQKMLAVCISGKNRTQYEYVEVNGIKCLYFCPLPAGTFIKENFTRLWSNATQWPNGVVPQPGDNVTLNGNWTVVLDVDPNPLNNFTIDGTLIADDSRDVTIIANFIHIRAGNFTAGSPGTPFMHNLTFQLNGQKTSPVFTVDPLLSANKLFVVSGSLNLYGNAPSSVSTHLSQSALINTTTLFVGDSTGWAAGDTLVLSPSFSKYNEFESVTIQSINADGSITITAPLNYTHYGASSLTINNHYGRLDTRTRVGHVNRNIKIVPGPDAGWGFTVTVYGFQDGDITRIGSVQLSGVQFQDGGQLQTLNSPLVFMNLQGSNTTSTSSVSATSFVNCKANCIYVKNSQNVTLNNNILYNAYVFGAQLSQIQSVTFTNNLIIGVSGKPTLPEGSELVACIWVEEYVNALTDNVAIKNNYCMGSAQDGFALPFLKCTELQINPFANNTVSSAKIGFILNTNHQTCQAFSYAKAFACAIGQISASMGVTQLIFDHFIMADNVRSVTLKSGDGEGRTNHSAYLYNSYISAVSRPTCAECYGPAATTCTDTHGMRMFVPSANGEQTPKKFNSGFDVICKQPVYDSKSFLVNNTFDNYRQNYTGVISSLCSKNYAFKPHRNAFDQSGSVYLFTSKCSNCDNNSYLRAQDPDPNHIGWFGGCGDIVCTGFHNYLIQDLNGTFFGSKATIIPKNTQIGNNEPNCTFSTNMNAYTCLRQDFSVLEYQNVAADFKKRIMWPVSLKYDSGNYTTLTNGWREWDWLGLQPQNGRFGRFVSIVRLNQTYNMSFTALPPAELQVQIQKRQPLGEKEHYIVARIYYPLPNSIRVKLNNQIVDPILLTDFNNTASGTQKDLNTSQCGSNIYYYTNRTIAFVVTAQNDCLITVEVTQSVQLTTHFAADISTFFSSNSSITNFINNLCALLQITDTSRVKIVGVFSGSTAVTTSITPSTTTSGSGAATDLSTINSNIAAATTSGALASGLSNIGLGSVLGVTSVYNQPPAGSSYGVQPSSGQESSSSSSKLSTGMIAGIAVAGVVLLVGAIFTTIYLLRRRSKVIEEIVSHEDEMVHEKSVDKEKASYMFNETSEVHNESQIKIKSTKVNPNVLKVHQVAEPSEVIDY